MKYITYLLLVFYSLCFAMPFSSAQSIDTLKAKQFFDEGEKLINEKKYEEAAKQYEQARQMFKATNDWNKWFDSQLGLAKIEILSKKYNEAIERVNAVLDTFNRKVVNSPKQGKAFNYLAYVYENKLDKTELAIEYYNKTINLLENNENFENDLAAAYNSLGETLIKLANHTKAEGYLNKALKIREKQQDCDQITKIYNSWMLF
mgnify:CR=1 FL=1